MEVLFIIVKKLKQSKCPLTNEWMYKCDLFIHRVEYYSAMEKNAKLIHDKTCMKLKKVKLIERSQP